jgi:hypothetical protein
LEAFLISASVVALAEIGDKTQPANHGAAGAIGTWLSPARQGQMVLGVGVPGVGK